jgi:CBS domain-containing protein
VQLDLAHTQAWFAQQIQGNSDYRTLRTLHDSIATIAKRWRERRIPGDELRTIMNRWHDLLIARVLQLTVAELESAEHGAPPAPFCWLLLGSDGRAEQTLHPDQDNALLYADTDDPAVGRYFQHLAERAIHRLSEVGYPFCPGYVMATNPRWNAPLSLWQERTEDYLAHPNWDNARYLMLLADLRPLYGDKVLAERFRSWFLEKMSDRSYLYWSIAEHNRAQPVALDFWGRFRLDLWGEHQGTLQLKEGGYLPIVNAVRLWSVAHALSATSTEQRIRELHQFGIWDDRTANAVLQAHALLSDYRLWGNHLDPRTLSVEEQAVLKIALQTAKLLQKHTAKRFRKP